MIEGLSDKKAALLIEAGITSISKLVKIKGDAIEKKAAKIKGISASGLSAMVTDAKSKAVAKRAPPIKYLLDDDNPFRKKYGSAKDEFKEKAWVTAIQGEPAFAGVVCIKKLVMHIVIKTRDFYEGTNHEDD